MRQVSSGAGGFDYPSSVATDPRTGHLYVGDLDNYRVQEFSASGAFLSMFGSGVDRSMDSRASATSAQRDFCTAASGDVCGSGADGTGAGQLKYAGSIAVDPVNGTVYVLERDLRDDRVDEYTADGRFLWTTGRGVNVGPNGNLCRSSEVETRKVRCGPGREERSEGLEHEAFKFASQDGDLLAAGGPHDLLYVGDEHRVQELDAAGKWVGEIPLISLSAKTGSSVGALAVAGDGELYLVYATIAGESAMGEERADTVRRFDRAGAEVGRFVVSPRLPGATIHIDGIALDPAVHTRELAVIGVESGEGFHARFGFLYEAQTGSLIGEFPPPADNDGLTFNRWGDLYVAATDDQQVVGYVPGSPMEMVSGPVSCGLEPGQSAGASFECALHRQWLGEES